MIIFNSENMIKNSIFLFLGLIATFSIILYLFKIDYSTKLANNVNSIKQERDIAVQSLNTKIISSCPAGYVFTNGHCEEDSANKLSSMPLSQVNNQIMSVQKQSISMVLDFSKVFSLLVLIIGFISFFRTHEIQSIVMPIMLASFLSFMPIMLNSFF
jgi:hypothetical protein